MYHCSQLAIAIRAEQWLDTKQNYYNNNTIKILSKINYYRTIQYITDHFSQFCILNFSTNRDLCDQSKSKRLTCDFSNYSETKFLSELSEIDLMGTICNTTDINKSFSTFHNKLNKRLSFILKIHVKQLSGT